jgi:hypothetical protein
MNHHPRRRRIAPRPLLPLLPLLRPLLPWLLAAVLAGCQGDGGDDDPVGAPPGCSVSERQAWLGSYLDEWYFWTTLAPRPDPGAFASVDAYFQARLYMGNDARFPADRWSRSEPTESFVRFYGEGATLGYGVAVNGLEAVDDPGLPLQVRYVDPQSDAARQGVRRGDTLVSIGGRSAAELVAANDFAALTAQQAGDRLEIVLRDAVGVERALTLAATVFRLTPVAGAMVHLSPGGRRLGYLMVKDMIAQAQDGLQSAFAGLRAQGVQDLVLDLRYNGGGLVSIGALLASYVAGAPSAGRTYASLVYNDRRSANDQRFDFGDPPGSLGLARVFVLAGARTCSASEQVINGLRGAGVQVIVIGDVTCGKPVGSLPRDDACGTTYSVVNFESLNARGEGRWFDGFDATCAVAEDWRVAQGAAQDPLVVAAAHWADTGACASLGQARKQPLAAAGRGRSARPADERTDMLPR